MPAGERRDECDLIMKGGITSGIAYPAAVLELHRKYDFVNIGGASAGAIAAAMTAAAQYGYGGFERLAELRDELATPGLVPRLFQATKETRPLLRLLLAVQQQRTSWAKATVFGGLVVARLALPAALWTAAGFAALAVLLRYAGATWSSMRWPAVVVLVAALLLTWLVAVVGCVVFRLWRAAYRHLPTSGFGVCLGTASDSRGQPALTEWLHARIQAVAGKPDGDPLTFGDLAARGVHLCVMTTDLTQSRPVRFPQREPAYHYCPDEFEALFPEPVLRHLTAHSTQESVLRTECGARTLRALPTRDLPVLVAIRMSLALPVMLASVPLWTVGSEGAPLRHWMSDGGISSNFPMHFFDAWVPRRPTFGLDLAYRTTGPQQGRPVAEYVHLFPESPPPPARIGIRSLTTFLGRIVASMQNWRDNLQAELPGFHERIAQINLGPDEGGMNLTMPRETVERVSAKGAVAGRRLREEFDWRTHQLRRYRIFMGMLQEGLVPAPEATGDIETVRAAWDAGLAKLLEEHAESPDAASAAWYRAAHEATLGLLASADAWLGPPAPGSASRLTFRPDPPLNPPARMRITPDV